MGCSGREGRQESHTRGSGEGRSRRVRGAERYLSGLEMLYLPLTILAVCGHWAGHWYWYWHWHWHWGRMPGAYTPLSLPWIDSRATPPLQLEPQRWTDGRAGDGSTEATEVPVQIFSPSLAALGSQWLGWGRLGRRLGTSMPIHPWAQVLLSWAGVNWSSCIRPPLPSFGVSEAPPPTIQGESLKGHKGERVNQLVW